MNIYTTENVFLAEMKITYFQIIKTSQIQASKYLFDVDKRINI